MVKTEYSNKVYSIQAKNILNDICESEKILASLKKIPIGKVLWIPTVISDYKDPFQKRMTKRMIEVKYTVVEKNKRMIICEKQNGIRECFTYNDLLTIVERYGGLKDGKSE